MAEPDAQWVVAAWGKALGRDDAVAPVSPVPVRDQPSSPRNPPRSGFRQGLLVGMLLIGVFALIGWLAFRQRGPEPVSGAPTPNNPRTEPGMAKQKVRPALLDCTGENGVSAAEMRKAQKAWAEYLGRPVEESVEIDKGVKMVFVLVPPGKFQMGSPEDQKGRGNDETLHVVTLTEPYYLGKYEVTQAQYQALVGEKENNSHFKGADLPVESMSWEMAKAYGEQLTKMCADNNVYRLPTEAEWEYACRGGRPSSQPFGIGDSRSLSSLQANFDGNHPYGGADNGPYLEKTCAVGPYNPNALDLYDMHGNVLEWCIDCYGPYAAGEATNPSGPSEGPFRVNRGGGWISDGSFCRAAFRSWSGPERRIDDLGFRLALSVPSGGK